MEQLENSTIDFGEAQKGKTYAEVWSNHQDWVLWFTQHYEKSNKPSHQQLMHYINLMVESAEMHEGYVPVSAPEPALGIRPKAKTKPKAAAAMSISAETASLPESDHFEMVNPMMLNLEQRMLRMEEAMTQIVSFIESKGAQQENP